MVLPDEDRQEELSMGRISIDGYEPAHLSFSTVSSYRMCAKKLQLQKILRLEEHPGLASIGGNVVHSVTEALDLAEFFGDHVDNRSSEGEQSH